MRDRVADLTIAKLDRLEERRVKRQAAYTPALAGAGAATAVSGLRLKNTSDVAGHARQAYARHKQAKTLHGAAQSSVKNVGRRHLKALPKAAGKVRLATGSKTRLAAGGALVALGAANEAHRRTSGKPYSSWYDR